MLDQFDHLDVREDGDVLRVTLDSPGDLNPITQQTYRELVDLWPYADHESNAKVIVLTGAGDCFSAGGNVEWMQREIEEPDQFRETIQLSELNMTNMAKLRTPIIARINGDCIGGSLGIALHADILVATRDARFGDPHVDLNLGMASTPMLMPLGMSFFKAKELMLTGETISATTAREEGLLNYVVDPEDLDDKVDELADCIASKPAVATGYIKRTVNGHVEAAHEKMLSVGLAREAVSQRHEEHHRAVKSFLDE